MVPKVGAQFVGLWRAQFIVSLLCVFAGWKEGKTERRKGKKKRRTRSRDRAQAESTGGPHSLAGRGLVCAAWGHNKQAPQVFKGGQVKAAKLAASKPQDLAEESIWRRRAASQSRLIMRRYRSSSAGLLGRWELLLIDGAKAEEKGTSFRLQRGRTMPFFGQSDSANGPEKDNKQFALASSASRTLRSLHNACNQLRPHTKSLPQGHPEARQPIFLSANFFLAFSAAKQSGKALNFPYLIQL